MENLWDILLGDATITRARNMPFQEWIDSNLHNSDVGNRRKMIGGKCLIPAFGVYGCG